MSEHTPTPWKNYGDFIRGPEEGWICQFFDRHENDFSDKDANVARIVECVNGYDALLDRIAELEKEITEARQHAGISADLVVTLLSTMQAAVVADKAGGHYAAMGWITSYLTRTGSMPENGTETASEFFNRQVSVQKAFTKAKCSAK